MLGQSRSVRGDVAGRVGLDEAVERCAGHAVVVGAEAEGGDLLPVAIHRDDDQIAQFPAAGVVKLGKADLHLVRQGHLQEFVLPAQLGDWHLTPGLSVVYFEEEQNRYTDSLGIEIPEQTVSLGRLMFGPEAAYHLQLDEDWWIRPQLGLQGIWDFADAEVVDVATGSRPGATTCGRASRAACR